MKKKNCHRLQDSSFLLCAADTAETLRRWWQIVLSSGSHADSKEWQARGWGSERGCRISTFALTGQFFIAVAGSPHRSYWSLTTQCSLFFLPPIADGGGKKPVVAAAASSAATAVGDSRSELVPTSCWDFSANRELPGEFHSPDFPLHYPNRTECMGLIVGKCMLQIYRK